MIKIFTDGGSRGNPGNAACAFVVLEDEKVVYFDSAYLNQVTNNFAEYAGLIMALKYLVKAGINEVSAYLDSELVVKQLNGEYKVKDENIKKHYDQIVELKKSFKSVSFNHVRREENKLADKLVNIVLDAVEKVS